MKPIAWGEENQIIMLKASFLSLSEIHFQIETATNVVAGNKYTTVIFGIIHSNIPNLLIKISLNKTSIC